MLFDSARPQRWDASWVCASAQLQSLESYVYGFAKQVKALPFDTGEQAAVMAQVLLARLAAGEYPYLFEPMAKHVLQPDYSYLKELEFRLDLVLNALEQARDGHSSPKNPHGLL